MNIKPFAPSQTISFAGIVIATKRGMIQVKIRAGEIWIPRLKGMRIAVGDQVEITA